MEFISLIKVLFNCGSGVEKSIKIYLELVLHCVRSAKIARVQMILAIQGFAEMLNIFALRTIKMVE